MKNNSVLKALARFFIVGAADFSFEGGGRDVAHISASQYLSKGRAKASDD